MKTRREVLRGIAAIGMMAFAANSGLAKTAMPKLVEADINGLDDCPVLQYVEEGRKHWKSVLTATLDVSAPAKVEAGELVTINFSWGDGKVETLCKVNSVEDVGEGMARIEMVEQEYNGI